MLLFCTSDVFSHFTGPLYYHSVRAGGPTEETTLWLRVSLLTSAKLAKPSICVAMATLTNLKFDWKWTILHFFCGCDARGKAHFLRSTHLLCCIEFALVLASITWNLTLLAPLKLKLLAYGYQQVKITSKMVILGTPSKGGSYIKWWNFVKCPKFGP